uniref:(northern house mosquito) hypothetical protein n=1 Tax=Culex pipiens TaxID=7175 RepID=A0A8D8BNQ9_CULPI
MVVLVTMGRRQVILPVQQMQFGGLFLLAAALLRQHNFLGTIPLPAKFALLAEFLFLLGAVALVLGLAAALLLGLGRRRGGRLERGGGTAVLEDVFALAQALYRVTGRKEGERRLTPNTIDTTTHDCGEQVS